MKRLTPLLILTIALLNSTWASANDTLIYFAKSVSIPGSSWRYLDNNTNLNAVAWRDSNYVETGSWKTGNSELGYGDGDENTCVEAGSGATCSPSGTKYTTTYFRKTFYITDPSIYSNFVLQFKRDDGLQIFINGTRYIIDNLSDPVSHATFASNASDDGENVFSVNISPSVFFGNGRKNVIAVDVHQTNATSSDLTFDLQLIGDDSPPPLGDLVIFPFGQNLAGPPSWNYKGGGTNLDGIAWKDLGYAEPGWINASSALGFGSSPPPRNTAIPENTSAGGGGNSGSRYPTLYFRKVVNIANPSAYAAFKIETKFDDAIVVWVNGVEAYRNNVSGTPNYADWASGILANNNGADILSTTVPTAMFVAGNNIIAVEIHQAAATSSDLFFDMQLTALGSISATLVKGPYLQLGNETAVTIRWQTDAPTNSRIMYGTVFGTYTDTANDANLTNDHSLRLTGLTPDTKYFYTIGSSTQTLQAGADNYVLTLPPSSTTRKLRFAAIGDCGNNSTNQRETKNALLNYLGADDLDALITLGDNAYSSGLETEFQTNFFDVYKDDLLKNKKLYTAPGNHDYGNSSGNTGVRNNAYYNNFSMPAAAECGGIASGTEAYYSFDVGNVHFLSLDSYGRENGNTTKVYDTAGAQATWVKNDLAANTKKWTVVYFHHPPYTKTSHNSDTELGDLGAMRENFIRILERYGVDLVLCGHSHGYERSYLLKNYYKTNPGDPTVLETNFNFSNHTATGNNQNGTYNGSANSCAYTYNSGQYNHGSIYLVAGSAGQVGGSSSGYPHNAMYYSNNSNGGSLYFEVDSNRLTARFVSYTGTGATPTIRDSFTIFKDVNRVYNISVPKDTPLELAASWRGNYYWPSNGGATTQAVTVPNTANGVYVYTVRDAASNNCLQDVYNVTVFTPLPVTISSFDATLDKDKVLLDWSTSQEQNNKYFTIERSLDATNFSFLGKVNGAGNSTVVNNYRLIDYSPAEGSNFYRLSQTDIDANVKYHGVKRVNYKSNADFGANILNNGNGQISVLVRSKSSTQLNMRVIDMTGKEVLSENFSVGSTGTVKNLNLHTGVYILVLLDQAGERITDKIIVH